MSKLKSAGESFLTQFVAEVEEGYSSLSNTGSSDNGGTGVSGVNDLTGRDFFDEDPSGPKLDLD